LEGRTDDIFATLGVIFSRKTRSLEARIFKGAFIAVIARHSIFNMYIGAYAICTGIIGAYVSVVAGLVVTAFAFAGIRLQVTGRFLSAVQITGALDTNEFFRAFSTGAVSVFVALDTCVGDRMALRSSAVAIF